MMGTQFSMSRYLTMIVNNPAVISLGIDEEKIHGKSLDDSRLTEAHRVTLILINDDYSNQKCNLRIEQLRCHLIITKCRL